MKLCLFVYAVVMWAAVVWTVVGRVFFARFPEKRCITPQAVVMVCQFGFMDEDLVTVISPEAFFLQHF